MGKIAFSIGPFHVYWYGMILALAVVAAIVSGIFQARLRKQSPEKILDIALFGVPIAIICARGHYIMTNWVLYAEQPGEMVSLWHGGVSFTGAAFGLLLTIVLYSKWKNLNLWCWADILTPGLALAQAVGSLANFINQEGFGAPSNLAWSIYIDFNCRPAGYEQFDFFQPLFLYESLSSLVFFLLATALAFYQVKSGKGRTGILFLVYFIFLASIRFILESLELNRILFIGQLTADQVISVITVGVCAYLLAAKIKK